MDSDDYPGMPPRSRRARRAASCQRRTRRRTTSSTRHTTFEADSSRRATRPEGTGGPPRSNRPTPLIALAALSLAAVVAVVGLLAYRAFDESLAPGKAQATRASEAGQDRSLAPVLGALASDSAVKTPPAQPLPGNPELSERLLVCAAGDIMLDRRVSDLIEAKGGEEPLAAVAHILKRAEVSVANLETPLSTRGSPKPGKDVTFEGNPKGIKGLSASGLDFVSLANNHALDYGPEALADTIELLDENGIGHAGAGADAKEAWSPAIKTLPGKRVAFLGFSYIQPSGFLASADRPGIAGARGVSNEIETAIEAAGRRAEFVIVSFHWGVEYTDYPVDNQKELGRLAIDAGADLVASHHPHVIQGIEVYKGKLIAYSLGDFVFDHFSRKTGEAFILEAAITPAKTLSAMAIPVYLDHNGKPEVVTGSDADSILGRLKEISEGFGTKMRIEDDVATLILPATD
ncbi:MAG: CapA family protein [Actinobacteria bacterium]|nr:MAG: CapA family protein [Actinomycetota bacterium]